MEDKIQDVLDHELFSKKGEYEYKIVIHVNGEDKEYRAKSDRPHLATKIIQLFLNKHINPKLVEQVSK